MQENIRQKLTKNPAIIPVDWPAKHCLAFTTSKLNPNNIVYVDNTYGGFNLGLHVGDNEISVQQNRQVLQQYLPEHCKIQWLNQVHQSHVQIVDTVTAEPITADAQITRQKNIALAIMTADCLPILLAAEDGSEVAAIHGGWRCLADNIIEKTINLMHTPRHQIIAWLGPCISAKHFEISQSIQTIFEQQNSLLTSAFQQINTKKCLADLHKIATVQLQTLQVNKIFSLAHCTYAQSYQYYSYRRDKTTGRMVTLICCL
jgi:hypothetical protein